MTIIETLIVIVLAIALVAIFSRYWFASRSHNQGSNLVRKTYPIWAAQGPFDSGEQSAAAMRYAYIAVLGREGAESLADAIDKHAVAFNNEPDEWEQVRQKYLELGGSDKADQVTKVKELDQVATNIAIMINLLLVKIRIENDGDLPKTFEQDQFIVGYIGGVAAFAARIGGTDDDVGHVTFEVLNQVFSGRGLALSESMIDWKNSGNQVFKDAALLGMNEFVNAHRIIVTRDKGGLEKAMHELKGLETYLTTMQLP